MLTHIVVWKYKPETTDEEREGHRARLRHLKNTIAEIVDLRVGADALRLDRSYDTGLVATFESWEDLDAYTVHPTHQEVASLGKRLAAHVASVDFMS